MRAKKLNLCIPLVAAMLLLSSGALGAQPEPRIDLFLECSARATSTSLDSLAMDLNPALLPLVVQAVDAQERRTGRQVPNAYEAFSRWHFWLGRQLDPEHHGLWSVRPPWLGTERSAGWQVAVLASLEMTQLRALAQMAERRGHVFDALIWWRDHAQLQRRIQRLHHDGRRGCYVDRDPMGRAAGDSLGIASLLPIGLAAPGLLDVQREHAWQILVGTAEEMIGDEQARVRMMQRLDSLDGYSDEIALQLLDPAVNAQLLVATLEQLRAPRLVILAKQALSAIGLAVSDSIALRMGSAVVPLARADLQRPLGTQARVGVRYLRESGLLLASETDRLVSELAVFDVLAKPDSDALAQRLAAHLADWRARDLASEQKLRSRTTPLPPHVNGTANSAQFRFRREDALVWAQDAFGGIRRDLMEHHLRSRPKSDFRARLMELTAGRGEAVQLELIFGRPLSDSAEHEKGWTAAWTDGHVVLPPMSISPTRIDRSFLQCQVEQVPSEDGLWWLIVDGPFGAPRYPPGITVVEPLLAWIQSAAHEQDQHILTLESFVRRSVEVRIELEPPAEWVVEPTTRVELVVEPGARVQQRFTVKPTADAVPGLYPLRWRVFEADGLIIDEETSAAVALRWLRIGPFSTEGLDPLARENPPETRIDLQDELVGADGPVRWTRLHESQSSSDGWTHAVEREQAPGVYYALTAFTTISRDVVAALESDGRAMLHVNGRPVLRSEGEGIERDEISLVSGTNYLMVELLAGAGEGGRFRLDLRDLDGQPLRSVDNRLERLLDGYAYLEGANVAASSETQRQRELVRLIPISYRDLSAQRVSVVGSFNGWSPVANPMVPVGDGEWHARVRLRPGRFEYKLVIDGTDWIPDPSNPRTTDDGFGGLNSILLVD